MSSEWRRFGWQQMTFMAPADWYLTKISTERASGELWLSDADLPRLQVKWNDAAREKKVNPKGTLTAYLASIERAAKKRKLSWQAERDLRFFKGGQADVSSLEGFHWTSEIEAYGAIWYSPKSLRVTLSQVNGKTGESDLKALAKRVLNSLSDAPQGELDLWTAYDLTCSVPHDFTLAEQHMETGRTELDFVRGKQGERLACARYGLAAIALERVGDLGDWAYQQRFKAWYTYDLKRELANFGSWSCVHFSGLKKSWRERLRQRIYAFLGRKLPVALSAWVWHCPEENVILIVEHQHDPRDDSLVPRLAEHMLSRPELVAPPKG
ncbi:MAG: hypothetical protein HZB16_02705 [Armatimonadetes bacterium]|nr:hypothetical protein [Armatimonadota bacterium]